MPCHAMLRYTTLHHYVQVLLLLASVIGCYMAVTYGGFSANTTRWYNLLHMSSGTPDTYSICKEAEFSGCANLTILDVTVVHGYMLIVTSKALIRSQYMTEAIHDAENPKVSQYRNCTLGQTSSMICYPIC